MNESIELTITVRGIIYAVRCGLPQVVKASSGPMSVRSAIEPAIVRLTDRMVEILDARMERSRIVWIDHGTDLTRSAGARK